MSNRGQNVAKPIRDAAIYAALSTGAETHEAIAKRLGVSRQHVSRVAVEHRADLDAAATLTMKAAIDGPTKARQMAADATPDAIEVILALMRGDGGDGGDDGEGGAPAAASVENAVRLAAAKTILDRGGVPVRSEIDAAIATDPDRLLRLRAMLRAKGDEE